MASLRRNRRRKNKAKDMEKYINVKIPEVMLTDVEEPVSENIKCVEELHEELHKELPKELPEVRKELPKEVELKFRNPVMVKNKVKNKVKRAPNKWNLHVKNYRKNHPNISYKQALKDSKLTYKK